MSESIKEKLNDICTRAIESMEKATTTGSLEEIRVAFLGKKGELKVSVV